MRMKLPPKRVAATAARAGASTRGRSSAQTTAKCMPSAKFSATLELSDAANASSGVRLSRLASASA